MRTIEVLRPACLLAAAALAACGGGGGSGGGGGGGTNGGGAGSAAFALDDGNALTAGALAIRFIEHSGLVAELPLLTALELDDRRVAQYDLPCGGTFVELRHVDADNNGTISVTDSLSAEHRAPCAGVAASKITLRLSVVELQNFRIEGAADFEVESAAGDRIVGTFSLATVADFTLAHISFGLTNIAATSTRDGKTERLSSGRFDRRFGVQNDTYSFDFAGQINSEQLGGQYSFSTPVRFTGTWGQLPTAGELVAVAGPTRVRIAASSVPAQQPFAADYQLDTGSGFGAPRSVRWRDLTTGLLFYWIPNDPPVISSLEVVPAAPPINSTVTAYAAATDPDGDALSFRFSWTAGSSTYSDFGPVFHTGGLRKGDVVSVTVRVSDGRAEATRSTSFTIANSPPIVTSLTIDPPAPRAIDDLTATATYEDLDGDAVTVLEFEWQIDGVTIEGATDDVLPRGAFAKGDIVTAIVHVTDGSLAVSRQESVTIGDTLPQLTWLSPATVAYGAPFGTHVVAADPDGEALPASLRYTLRYGPAGMEVDPLTGQVTWTPNGPMFERSMNVRYGVGTSIEGAGTASASVTVEDSLRRYPLARSSLDPGRWYSGLRAGDFDADGDAEMLMLTEGGVLYELEATGDTYRQSWMYPFALSPSPLALATANVDGHPAHEIFIATGNVLLRVDGVERRVTASAALPIASSFGTCADMEIADLDGDAALELVCSVSPRGGIDSTDAHPLLIIDPSTLAVEAEIQAGELGNDIAIGNVDDDAALEIVTWRGFVFDGVTRELEWQSPETFPGLAVGDVTGDAVAEIVTCYPTNFAGNTGRVYSARSRSALFDLPHLGFTTNLVANVDGLPGNEILMAGSRLAAYRYEPSGSVSTVFYMVLPNDRGATTLAVANVDADDELELVMGTNAPAIAIADRPAAGLRIEWSSETLEPAVPQTLSGPFYGGELARSPASSPQPLFMTPQTGFRGARLLAMNPTTGDLTFSPEIAQGESFFDPGDLAVVDFDRDGTDEAFITVADRLEAAVGAYEFFAGQLRFRSPPVLPGWPIGDVDHGDFNGDGNDDLVALAEDGSLRVYDASAPTDPALFSEQLPPGGRTVVVADLDGSGPPEIIATTWGQVIVFSRANASAPFVRKYESETYAYTGAMTAGDVDGDGRVEIFLVYSGPGPYVQRFNERLEPVASLPLVDWSPGSLSIESSAFARKNLVGTYYGPTGSQVRVFDAGLGEDIWLSPPFHGQFPRNSIHFVDVAGDGALRMALGTYSGMFLTR